MYNSIWLLTIKAQKEMNDSTTSDGFVSTHSNRKSKQHLITTKFSQPKNRLGGSSQEILWLKVHPRGGYWEYLQKTNLLRVCSKHFSSVLKPVAYRSSSRHRPSNWSTLISLISKPSQVTVLQTVGPSLGSEPSPNLKWPNILELPTTTLFFFFFFFYSWQ